MWRWCCAILQVCHCWWHCVHFEGCRKVQLWHALATPFQSLASHHIVSCYKGCCLVMKQLGCMHYTAILRAPLRFLCLHFWVWLRSNYALLSWHTVAKNTGFGSHTPVPDMTNWGMVGYLFVWIIHPFQKCYLNVLHWWAWVTSENRYWSYEVEGGMARGSNACGQEEPGRIMRVTGSCPKQKSSNYTHQSKIKGFNNQWDFKKKKSQLTLIWHEGVPSRLCALFKSSS